MIALPLVAASLGLIAALFDSVRFWMRPFESAIIGWPASSWLLLKAVTMVAFVVGLLLAPFFLVLRARLPRPSLRFLITIGALVAQVPMLVMDGLPINFWVCLNMAVYGVVAAVGWWVLVQRPFEMAHDDA